MATGYYEIKQAKDGQFYFNLKAANHETILSSELYKAKSGAENGISSVQTNCLDDALYERRTSANDKDYFVLKARNHQEIGHSETYESAAAMEKGIESVKNNGVSSTIKDKTDSAARAA